MPTYSYKCTECGHAFDIHQSFSDDSLTTCPSCQGSLRKVFSPVGITFKGSGFYRTDSRSTNSSSSSSAGAAKAESSGASVESGSDSGSDSSSASSDSTSSADSSPKASSKTPAATTTS